MAYEDGAGERSPNRFPKPKRAAGRPPRDNVQLVSLSFVYILRLEDDGATRQFSLRSAEPSQS